MKRISRAVPKGCVMSRREEISRGKLLEIAKLLGVEGKKLTSLA